MKTIMTIKYPAFAIVAFACFAPLRTAHAVIPAPDGGYPGGNTAEGQNALFNLTTGGYNTAVGLFSLRANATNSFNTAVGAGTLLANTADKNTATGAAALLSNTTGDENTANGALALLNTTTGFANSAFGLAALYHNQTGIGNTAIGESAGAHITGSDNVCIGAEVQGVDGENNTIRIADNLPSMAGLSACYIGGIAGQTVNPSGAAGVYVDNDGKLGVFLSSQRFKRDVEPMNKTSEAILALKPVTFHYKSDAKNTPCFGLIAEEVAKVDPALVVQDKEGKPYSVRYDQVNAMLLNEFLKEHKAFVAERHKVQQLEANAARQQKQIEALTAALQKVSTELGVRKPPAPTVANNQR